MNQCLNESSTEPYSCFSKSKKTENNNQTPRAGIPTLTTPQSNQTARNMQQYAEVGEWRNKRIPQTMFEDYRSLWQPFDSRQLDVF
jgi:hypothetical protein